MKLYFALFCFVLCPLAFVLTESFVLPCRADDGKLLESHKVPSDGPGLLEFLKKRGQQSLSDTDLKKLVEQLGDDDFFERQKASRKLAEAGSRATAHLREALSHRDLEVRHRAGRCLENMGRESMASIELASAVVRELARLEPAGTVPALLAYLDRVEDLSVALEIRSALTALAVKDGKPAAALVAAIQSKSPLERSTAALALVSVKSELPTIRKLLADPEDKVRLPVAVALARLGESDAIPVLIDLMDRVPSLQLGSAEDILFRLAGPKSPHLADASATTRKKYRRAWESWWKDAKDSVKLDVLTEAAREPGHTTIVLLDENKLIDLDDKGEERWSIGNLQTPLDVQRLPGERVLIAEHGAGRVAERDRKGEIAWEKKIAGPLVAQRLPNGNTFIATVDGLTEITRLGKEVFSYNPPLGQRIMRARKLPGGEILLVVEHDLRHSKLVRLDRFGNRVKEFDVQVNTSGGRIDVTPAGHALIPEVYNNRVQERDWDGKIVREIAIAQPITAVALPSGNLLITSMTEKRAVEFDRRGKEVWECKRDTRVTRAVRPQ